jgi:hypothetical protein
VEAVRGPTELDLFIVCVNNYQKLMLNLNNIKKNAVKNFQEENFKELVSRSFSNCIAAVNAAIDYLLDKLVLITFDDIRKLCISKLFKLGNQEDVGG